MLLAAGLSRLGRNGWSFVDTSRLIGTNNEYYRGSLESINAYGFSIILTIIHGPKYAIVIVICRECYY